MYQEVPIQSNISLDGLIVNGSLCSYSHHAEEERLGPSESNCGENTHRPSDFLQQGESNF